MAQQPHRRVVASQVAQKTSLIWLAQRWVRRALTEEVLGLKLNADWVVLSACNTASADGQASEAVSGLGRAFFYAGARSLLVSNWAVETVSARLLATGLFKQQGNKPATSRAEALRQSMRMLMKNEATDYDHPAFWAPFTLVGDGRGSAL